jgi:rod shape determining protein RodA
VAATEGGLFGRIPWGVVLMMIAIILVGALNLVSASQATMPNIWLKQLMWAGGGLFIGALIVRLSTNALEMAAYPAYMIVNVLLVLVLLIGTTKKGATRWIDLGFFNLQPSELAKITIILVVARYFGRFEVEGGYTLPMILRPMNLSRPLGLAAVAILRWVKQGSKLDQAIASGAEELPSLDPTWMKVTLLSVCAVWAAISVFLIARRGLHHMAVIAPVDIVLIPWSLRRSLAIGFGSAAAVATFALLDVAFRWGIVLKPYQARRVDTFLNPENDLQGAGYHSSQSMIAIGSGGFTGKGHTEGTQTQLSFLPENHTDFAFSVWAEEWGFVGAGLLVLMFLALLYFILRAARDLSDRFSVLLCVGAAAMVFFHVLVNIGMVTGLLPVVGMTLPFISYGGSSMLTMIMAVALAVNAAAHRRT